MNYHKNMALTESFFPLQSDSTETLEEKCRLNTNAAWGEIACDIVMPDRESDVSEYQSNAIVAREIIENRENTPNSNKYTVQNVNEMDEELIDTGCVKPHGIILPPKQPSFLESIMKTAFGLSALYYVGIKIMELPLLTNPVTTPMYFTH